MKLNLLFSPAAVKATNDMEMLSWDLCVLKSGDLTTEKKPIKNFKSNLSKNRVVNETGNKRNGGLKVG